MFPHAEPVQQADAQGGEGRCAAVARARRGVGRVEHDPAAVQHQHAVGERDGLVHVVRDEQDGRVVTLPEVEHQRVHPQPRQRVQRRERLVEQQQARRADQRPGQRRPLGLPAPVRRALAELKISMSGLPPDAGDKFPSELSGGMKKRAGLARALALDPAIVFLDEPTAGLDPIGAAEFDRLIRGLTDALGLTVFLVTHDLDTLHACCDRIAVLAEKRVLATGTIAELRRLSHPWVHDYFNGPRARAAFDPPTEA